jgi:hypothetical protein
MLVVMACFAVPAWAAPPEDDPPAEAAEKPGDDAPVEADEAPEADAADQPAKPAEGDDDAEGDDAAKGDAEPDDKAAKGDAEPEDKAAKGDAEPEDKAAKGDAEPEDKAAKDDAEPEDKAAKDDAEPDNKEAATKDDAEPDEDVAQDDDDGDVDDGDDEGEDAVAQPKKSKTPKGATRDPLTAFRKGDYAKARDGYLGQVSDRPDAPALHYRVAVSAALARDPGTAEQHAATVERLDPGNLVAIELAAAARVLRLKANPRTVELTQAQRALRDGRLRSAVRLATAALDSKDADQGALHRVRGMALLGLGRGDEANDALQSAAAFGHHDAGLWLALGDAARIMGDKSRAAYLYTLTMDGAAAGDPIQAVARARRARLGKTRKR